MPRAPPVTTTILPVTCMRPLVALSYCPMPASGQNQIQHRGVMERGAEQHERMPDRVLEAQAAPGMEDHAEAVEAAAGEHAADHHLRQHGDCGIIHHDAAPAEREI